MEQLTSSSFAAPEPKNSPPSSTYKIVRRSQVPVISLQRRDSAQTEDEQEYLRFRASFLPANPSTEILARDITKHVTAFQSRFKRNKNRVFMLDLIRNAESRNSKAEAKDLCTRLEKHFRSAFDAAGEEISGYNVATITVLKIRPGEGGQLPHYDTDDPRNLTGVLYCTPGSLSTSFARLDSKRREEVFHANKCSTTVPLDLRLSVKDFSHRPCVIGDHVIFEHSVPHHGVMHPLDAEIERIAVFVMFSPFHGTGQEYEQITVSMQNER